MKRAKRVWTDEQRKAAGDRMRVAQAKRWAKTTATESEHVEMAEGIEVPEASLLGISEATQGLVATLEPKSQVDVVATAFQAFVLPAIVDPVRDTVRVGSREVVLRVRTDGQMVSLQGPCLCGAAKREWHQICLKQESK